MPVVLNAYQVVTQAVRNSRDEFPSSDIRLARVDDITIRAIPRLLEAIQELIANGVEHNESDSPTVEVQVVQVDDKQAEIRISDNGPGIPDIELECLHPDNDINQLHHGSGLGLVFASWVVRLSEGDILFEENKSGGSVVSVTLQIVDV
jgi:K+-sensing histidine kinase KdpD